MTGRADARNAIGALDVERDLLFPVYALIANNKAGVRIVLPLASGRRSQARGAGADVC